MRTKIFVLLITFSVISVPAPLVLIAADNMGITEEIEYLMVVDDFMHEEIVARRLRVISQGEKLYPIIEKKLREVTDPMAVSRLLSLAVEAPGDKSKILPAIREFSESEAVQKNPQILRLVAQTFSAIGTEAEVPMLIEMLRHDDQKLRIVAADALGQIASPTAIAEIEQILKERARGLDGEAIQRDRSFLESYLAIAHIRYRALIAAAEGKK